jgi:glycosyltransferase involved in cell wall biosynthesis
LVEALAHVDSENRYVLVVPPGRRNQLPHLPEAFQLVTYEHSDVESMDHLAFPLFLKRLDADLFHIPLNRVPLTMVQPYVVTLHDMGRQLFDTRGGFRKQLSLFSARRSLMRAAKVIAVSAATRRDAQDVLGIPADHIRLIYNAPDPRFLMPEPSLSHDDRESTRRNVLARYQVDYPYVLYTGNIRPQKNIPRLIEAFAVLRGELGDHPQYGNLRLIIIGDEISRYPDVRLAANKTRVGHAVRFLGFVPLETLRAFYASAAAFAFPSLHEGFGLPPLEAMASGTPVVTSNVSSLPEVVGDAALLVNPENVFEIARALKDVLLDSGLRLRLIQRGYRQVARFSWEHTARQVLETYHESARG